METDGPDSYGYQSWLVATINAEAGVLRWTDSELARRCGMHKTTLGRYLRMERHLTVDQMAAIAAALGMDVVSLAQKTEQRRSDSVTSGRD